MSIFRSERNRWATPIGHARLRNYPALTNLGSSRELYETGLPRGSLLARLMADRERMSYWMAPGSLMRHRFAFGQIIVGKLGETWRGSNRRISVWFQRVTPQGLLSIRVLEAPVFRLGSVLCARKSVLLKFIMGQENRVLTAKG